MEQFQQEDASNWQCVIDSSSGNPYWYHKITRISTWENPFADNGFEIPNDEQHQQEFKALVEVLDGVADPEEIIDIMMVDSSQCKQASEILLSTLNPQTSKSWAHFAKNETDFIKNLLEGPVHSISNNLKILFAFAVYKQFSIFSPSNNWSENFVPSFILWDIDCKFIFSYTIALLMGHNSQLKISTTVVAELEKWLQSEVENSKRLTCLTSKDVHVSMIDSCLLHKLSTLASNGRPLCGHVLIWIASFAFR